MEIFFTSDSHFSHANILKLGQGRPFKDIHHHNEILIKSWNEVVTPEDTVFHLGDVALGPWPEGLECIKRLNGRKILIPGNHDRIFPTQSNARIERFMEDYKGAFQEIRGVMDNQIILGGVQFKLSHFPYYEEPIGERKTDRYLKYRPQDDGTPLIHGHTHQGGVLTYSPKNTLQISVGVDANDWTPVNSSEIIKRFNALQ